MMNLMVRSLLHRDVAMTNHFGIAILRIASSSSLLLLLLLCITAAPAQDGAEASSPKSALNADGVVHLPEFTVPLSSLSSDEAKRDFLDFVHGYESYFEGYESPSDLSERLFKPGVARLRAAFPVKITPQIIGDVQTDIVVPSSGIPKKNTKRVLINLHGGGFGVGARHGGQIASIPIASLGAIKVITVDYRASPDHKFPAASEDVAKVYREVLRHYRPQDIGIYGCSAGGMLTAESVAWFQVHKLPRPGAIGIFGAGALVPLVGDSNYLGSLLMTWPIESEDAKKATPYFDVPELDAKGPLVSPAYSPSVLAKFPPTLLISSTRDPGLSSAAYTQAQLTKAGVEADLHVWEATPHCWFAQELLNPNEPESQEAWDVIIKFFAKHLGKR